MIFLQVPNTTDIKSIVSTNDATVTGILMAVVIALGVAIIYLFKQNQQLHKDYISELKATTETLLKVNMSNNENAQKFHDFARDLIEIKNSIGNRK